MGPRERSHAGRSGRQAVPRFFTAAVLDGVHVGDVVELAAGEAGHAVRTLRLAPGAAVELLDGQGARVRGELIVERGATTARICEAVRHEPGPGQHGAPLPWIELFVAPPRAARYEALLDRVTQLGVAAIQPLRCARTGPEERAGRRDRQQRILREGCKQSGRTWCPILREPLAVEQLTGRLDGPVLLLEAEAAAGLPAALRATPFAHAPSWIGLAVGPEGGFDDAERALWAELGAVPAHLGPHVLRVETAAESALAVVAALLHAVAEQDG